LEVEVLAKIGMDANSFDHFHSIGSGTRSTLLTFPEEVEVTPSSSGLRTRFFLPKGCYATVLLREVLKRDI
jgi:tRNA(Glu) U13 pseudouridine synthase TruD